MTTFLFQWMPLMDGRGWLFVDEDTVTLSVNTPWALICCCGAFWLETVVSDVTTAAYGRWVDHHEFCATTCDTCGRCRPQWALGDALACCLATALLPVTPAERFWACVPDQTPG